MNANRSPQSHAGELDSVPDPTSVLGRMLDVVTSPAEVFAAVVRAPVNPANWFIPALLSALVGAIALVANFDEAAALDSVKPDARIMPLAPNAAAPTLADGTRRAPSAAPGATMSPPNRAAAADARKTTRTSALNAASETRAARVARATAPVQAWPADILAAVARGNGVLAIVVASFAGTFWSAFLLWALGRYVLRAPCRYLKALEIAGLTQVLLILATVISALLAQSAGDPLAQPALSLLAGGLEANNRWRLALGCLDVTYLWMAWALAAGLAALCQVGRRAAAGCVFGYWVALRLALIALS